jgi:transcriptional regulator with XRE-family HTH domain
MSANAIRERREAIGWTQRQLGDAAGVSDETVRKVEQGKHVRTKTIAAIDAALTEGERHGRSAIADADRPMGGLMGTQSDGDVSVPTSEQNVVRIKAQAIGWELSATYTDAEDRLHALEDISKAWAAMMGGGARTGGNVDDAGDARG